MRFIVYFVLILHLLDDKRMVEFNKNPDLLIISADLMV